MSTYFSTFRQYADPSVETIILQEDRSEQESVYVLIKEKETFAPILNLKLPAGHSAFEDSRIVNDTVLIGWGENFALCNIKTKEWAIFTLDGYFGNFTLHNDLVYVCSASDISCLSMDGTVKWTSASIAIDGVVINTIKEGIIYCSCEWDPPGGWSPYQLDLRTGVTLSQE